MLLQGLKAFLSLICLYEPVKYAKHTACGM